MYASRRTMNRTSTGSGLGTEKPGFYERLGWELWRGALAGLSEHGLILTVECDGERIW